MFFKKYKKNEVLEPLDVAIKWPSGLMARTESAIWFIKSGKKFKCFSERSAASWNLNIIEATDNSLSGLKSGGVLGFRDGSLIKDISDGKIYLVSENKIRHILDPDFIKILNMTILDVSRKEISIHEFGDDLNGFYNTI